MRRVLFHLCARGIGRAMSTAARPVASAAAHRASPRGVALAAAARPRAARVFPACRQTRASGGVGSGVVAPTRAAAEPATLETADGDDDDEHDDEHDDEAFSSYGDGGRYGHDGVPVAVRGEPLVVVFVVVGVVVVVRPERRRLGRGACRGDDARAADASRRARLSTGDGEDARRARAGGGG